MRRTTLVYTVPTIKSIDRSDPNDPEGLREHHQDTCEPVSSVLAFHFGRDRSKSSIYLAVDRYLDTLQARRL